MMMQNDARRQTVGVLRLQDNRGKTVADVVAVEAHYDLSIDGDHVMTLACSPGREEALVLGYLKNSGRICGKHEVQDLQVAAQQITVCLAPQARETSRNEPHRCFEPMLTPPELHRLFDDMHTHMALFDETGGVHSGALYQSGQLQQFVTDVARHNVLDRLCGEMLLTDRDTAGMVLTFTGRLAFEIVRKASAMNVAVLAGISAPTSAGIACAEKAGMTLIGFVRGNRMNVYTHPERIDLSAQKQTFAPKSTKPHLITVTAQTSGSGKTTLIAQLLPYFKAAGLRVGVVKCSTHAFNPGDSDKDSWRYRTAGATSVWFDGPEEQVMMTDAPAEDAITQAQRNGGLDLVIVESRTARVGHVYEVVRGQAAAGAFLQPEDGLRHTIVTDVPEAFPGQNTLPLNQPARCAELILADLQR